MANSVDPDETQCSAASHLGLHSDSSVQIHMVHTIFCKRLYNSTITFSGLIQHVTKWLYFSYFFQKTGFDIQSPVVQSIVSLTSLLRVISLTVLADSIYSILIFFAEKM